MRITKQLNTVINFKSQKSVADDLPSTQKSTLTNIQADGHEGNHRAITIKDQIDPEILHLLDTIPEGKTLLMTGGHKTLMTTTATEEDSQRIQEEDKNDYDNRGYSGSNRRSDNQATKPLSVKSATISISRLAIFST